MLPERKVEQIREVLKTASPLSRVYIGCDSNRFRDKQDIWHASYTTAVVIHRIDEEGIGRGAKVFTFTDRAQDYDQKMGRPMMRMMNEAYRTAEAYQQLEEDLLEFDVEVHLDINDDPKHGSNVARSAAVGYLTGVTGRPVMTKPDAFAASFVADHGVRGKFDRVARTHAGTRLAS
jgi:predicted RNase H-related nuclease YkuK (DUF458 family)